MANSTTQLSRKDELIQRVREAQEKSDALEASRIEANRQMREAIAQHEFLATACLVAYNDVMNARADLQRLIEREKWEMIR